MGVSHVTRLRVRNFSRLIAKRQVWFAIRAEKRCHVVNRAVKFASAKAFGISERKRDSRHNGSTLIWPRNDTEKGPIDGSKKKLFRKNVGLTRSQVKYNYKRNVPWFEFLTPVDEALCHRLFFIIVYFSSYLRSQGRGVLFAMEYIQTIGNVCPINSTFLLIIYLKNTQLTSKIPNRPFLKFKLNTFHEN